MPVYFYTTTDAYGCFSNFSRHGFELGGRYWPTAEHYVQAQKFAGTEHVDHVARARTPKEAAELGRRSRAVPLRADWEAVKDDIMRAAVRRKFEAHADIRAVLLGTGDEDLVENAPGDYYWGCGADGSGRNMLGHILMEVRAALHAPHTEPGASPDPAC
ncbi:MAG TPA: NADAR family protein [Urbifossiella sp.]|nr:NADAR family protein [Urbifossiella sp.]